MKKRKLYFESVADINVKYCYIYIYDEIDRINPFMGISITDEKELIYTFFANCNRNIKITADEWDHITKMAKEFLPEEIAKEERYDKWAKEMLENGIKDEI